MTACAACCAGLGYTELEIARLLSRRPEVMAIPCRQIEDVHTQLGAMCIAARGEVRQFVAHDGGTAQHGMILLRSEWTKTAAMVELYCDLTGQPPPLHAFTDFDMLPRRLMRLCFLRHHGRDLPPYEKQWTWLPEFCHEMEVSAADLTAWCTTWIQTPEAQRLGALLPLLSHLQRF